MTTVVFSIQTLDTALSDFADAWKSGGGDGSTHIGFENWESMHKVLSPKRLEVVRAMAGAGGLSIREIARRVRRDFKGVHSDVQMLVKSGVIDRNSQGKFVFPYDRIHVDFEIPAAA